MSIPNDNQIKSYCHCGLCMEELKEFLAADGDPVSPRDYQEIEVGFTKIGLQVWCKRHDCNIMHIDFQGKKHPANVNRHVKKD